MDEPALMTIGHSNREIDEFCRLLERHEVRTIVDVRAFPGSRRLPQFSQEQLSGALEAREVRYVHLRGLGGRRRPDPAAPPEWGDGWRNTSFRAYAQYVQSSEYKRALDELMALLDPSEAGRSAQAAHAGQVAIMCAEAVPWRCHRWLVSDTVVARGLPVAHILGDSQARRHLLTPFAQVVDGRVTWPGPPSEARLRLAPQQRRG